MEYKNKKADLSEFVFGKVQPQATDFEMAVLGALLVDKEGIYTVLDLLSPESFYLESHKHIYSAILALHSKSQPIDLLTVTEELRKSGSIDNIGGAYYLVELTSRVSSSANIEHHARVIVEKHILRGVIESATESIRAAYDSSTDAFELVESTLSRIDKLSLSNLSTQMQASPAVVIETIKKIEAASKNSGITGIPTGLDGLDKVLFGWQQSDLIIVAARPSMGKTSFAINTAIAAAITHKKNVAFFSLEMSNTQLAMRCLSNLSGLDSLKIKNGDLSDSDWEKVNKASERMAESNIFFNDNSAITVRELSSKCRKLKREKGLDLVIIDYLQLMSGDSETRGQSREAVVSSISRGLKILAKELDVPVIALSQLSRAVETRGGSKRPMLSDLRESGAIEQDADVVSFLYRPEYYGFLEDEDGSSLVGKVFVLVSKHRSGGLGSPRFDIDLARTKWSDEDYFNDIRNNLIPQSSVSNAPSPAPRPDDNEIPF